MQRRDFLTLLGGGALAWPQAVYAVERTFRDGGAVDDEEFWLRVRGRFLIPPERIYLNNGTLGPSPRVVVDAVIEHTRRVAATFPPGVSWDDVKRSLAGLVGGDPEGFVFPRNTTEAMSFVANGMELEEGDQVVVTDHEHIGGLEPWRMRAARDGLDLRTASLPVPGASDAEVLEAIWKEVTSGTRVVSVSHVTFTHGAVLPIGALAERCAARDIVLVVDGAHPPGMMRLDVASVGGDFYASSPHKWLLAPQGSGLLYLQPRWRERLWPSLASGGWDDMSLGAHRLNHLGTFDESRLAGLLAASEFFHALGMDRVEARVRHLRRRLQDGLGGIPGVRVTTPDQENRIAGMVSFTLDGVPALELQQYLGREHGVRTRVISEYGYDWMRLSTHVYNRPEEIDRVLDLLAVVARNGLPAGGTGV